MLTNAQVIQTKTSQGNAGADFQTYELNRYIQNIPLRQKKCIFPVSYELS